MRTVLQDWNSPAPAHWSGDARALPVSSQHRYSMFGIVAFRVAAALAVLAASFWITLVVLDYFEPVTKELRPTSWKTFGKASYDIRDGVVFMRGPNHIYVETECDVDQCDVEFSSFVERAEVANIQLVFFNLRGLPNSDPVVHDLANVRRKPVELRASAPVLTRKIQLLIYTPQEGEAVAFSNPILRVKPKS
jgi:hypothetical protein